MDSSLLGGLLAVGVVIVLSLLFRALRGDAGSAAPPPPGYGTDPGQLAAKPGSPPDENGDDDVEHDGLVVAVTSEGYALVPGRHAVQLLPPEEEGEEWKVGAGIKSSTHRAEKALGMAWRRGDLRGARVVHGAGDEAPWRLETLGPDGEYAPFGFETREAAEAARELFERQGIVQLGEDEDGRPVPPSSEQFAEARRIFLETEAELGMAGDEEPR